MNKPLDKVMYQTFYAATEADIIFGEYDTDFCFEYNGQRVFPDRVTQDVLRALLFDINNEQRLRTITERQLQESESNELAREQKESK